MALPLSFQLGLRHGSDLDRYLSQRLVWRVPAPSVIVDYFDVGGSLRRPFETDAPLVIYADAVLTLPLAFQELEAITGRRSEVAQLHRLTQRCQSACRHPGYLTPLPIVAIGKKRLGILALEAQYHQSTLTQLVKDKFNA
jgi:hypothetical protein